MPRHIPTAQPQNLRTYQIASPLASHWRSATCDEVECEQHRKGWVTVVDESTDLGSRQAAYIRRECRPASAGLASPDGIRRYREGRTEAGWTEFTFPAGQQCFKQHQVPLERPELYVVRDGVRGTRKHDRAEHWAEDCHEHTDRLDRLRQRG